MNIFHNMKMSEYLFVFDDTLYACMYVGS